jgi:hypothetical protein
MIAVAKKRSRPSDPPPTGGEKPPRSGTALHCWIDDDLHAALEAFRKATEPEPSKTRTVETALKDFLRLRGFWPPRETPPCSDARSRPSSS